MQDISQLKKIVIESFEAKGILSEIRAQIRASVFKVVEESEQNKTNFDWEQKNPLEITQNEDKLILALLIDDFLSYMDLQYTSNVFAHESNLKLKDEDKQARKRLFESIGLKESTSEPYLYQLLRRMNKPQSETERKDRGNKVDKMEENDSETYNMSNVQREEKKPNIENKGLIKEIENNEGEQREMMNNIELNELNQMNEMNRGHLDDDANQMYLNEPAVLDVTADSEFLKDFDHEESVENYS